MAAQEKKEKIIRKISVNVSSPKGVVYEGEADFIVAPGKEGVLGIGPDHTKIISLLRKGDLIIKNGGDEKTLSVQEGMLQVNQESVDILMTA